MTPAARQGEQSRLWRCISCGRGVSRHSAVNARCAVCGGALRSIWGLGQLAASQRERRATALPDDSVRRLPHALQTSTEHAIDGHGSQLPAVRSAALPGALPRRAVHGSSG
jgi:hypothetical protein